MAQVWYTETDKSLPHMYSGSLSIKYIARCIVILHTFNLFVFRYFIEDLRYDAKGTVKIPLVYPVTSVHYTSL